jgi:hypothetical protein
VVRPSRLLRLLDKDPRRLAEIAKGDASSLLARRGRVLASP